MSESKVVIALLAGLAAGAALGILFAPEAGTETRDKLSESLASLGESIKTTAAGQIDKLSGVVKDKVINTVKAQFGAAPGEHPDDLEQV